MIIKPNPVRETVQHRLGTVRGKVIQAYFGDEQQSAMGGLPLLGELEAAEGLVAGAASVLRDWRAPGQIKFSLAHLLLQRVMLICAGHEDGIDSNIFATDPAIGIALSMGLSLEEPARLATQASISRFENNIRALNLYRLAMFLLYRYITTKKNPPKSLRFDFDGSCCPTRGEQQHTTFRLYYNCKMYFPLFVFDEDGYLITVILRPGEDGEAELTVPVLKRLVKACREAWPEAEITVVMDAAFNDPKIYDWCEDNHVFYLIKLKAAGKPGGGLYGKSNELARNTRIAFVKKHGQPQYEDTDTTKNSVETEIRHLEEKKERKQKLKELNSRVVRRYDEFQHCTGKGGKDAKAWRQDRRVLAVSKYDDWGDHRSFWVTNIVGYLPQHLIEVVYSSRGKAELFIKDAKAFRCDKLSCEDFFANQCRLLMQVLAYQLMYRLRSLLPKAMQSMTLASVRDHFIRIPVIVKEKAKIIDLIWSRTFPFKIHMHALLDRLTRQRRNKPDWALEWQQWLTPIIAVSIAA